MNDDLAIPMIRLNPDGQSVKSENEAKRVPPVGEDSNENIKKAENNASTEEETSSERPKIMDTNQTRKKLKRKEEYIRKVLFKKPTNPPLTLPKKIKKKKIKEEERMKEKRT